MDSIQCVGFFFQMEKMRIRKVPVSSSCLVHSQPLKTTWRSLWGSAPESLLLRGKHTESGLSKVVFVLFYLCSITESMQQWILNGHIDLGVFFGHAKSQSKQKWYAFFFNSELWLFIRLFADFSQVQTESSQRSSLKRKSPLDEEEEEDSNDSFKLVSDNEEDVGTKEKVVVMFIWS